MIFRSMLSRLLPFQFSTLNYDFRSSIFPFLTIIHRGRIPNVPICSSDPIDLVRPSSHPNFCRDELKLYIDLMQELLATKDIPR